MIRCPSCRQDVEPRQIGFTWWGGLIGAKLLNHVECEACGSRFNGRSGQSNTPAIAAYMIIVGLLAFALMYALMQH